MQLWAGFVGVQVDEKTGTLTPKIGWFARTADDEEAQLKALQRMERYGKLSYSYRHETDTLPGVLAKMESIRQLTLRFNRFPVNIPAWVDKMNIGKLEIHGKLSEAEEAQLRQRFPNADISNTAKRELLVEDDIKEENPAKEEMVKNTSIISVDEALEDRLDGHEAFDPYDIRQVLE